MELHEKFMRRASGYGPYAPCNLAEQTIIAVMAKLYKQNYVVKQDEVKMFRGLYIDTKNHIGTKSHVPDGTSAVIFSYLFKNGKLSRSFLSLRLDDQLAEIISVSNNIAHMPAFGQ